jgi:hypothetical protein
MHDRRLSFRKPTLGRTYPTDIEEALRQVAGRLDALMSSSMNLAIASDMDLSGRISELNTRLVNDIILPSDQLSDDDARARLLSLGKDIQDVENTFLQNNVEIGQGGGQITSNVISVKQAGNLADQIQKAFNIYGSIVDRYGLIRGYVSAASALPATGQKLSEMLAAFDQQIKSLDQKISPVQKYQQDLEVAQAKAEGDMVQIDRDSVRRMQEWAAAVFQADEALKRIEAIALRKPVEPTPAARPPHNTPWALIGIAGVALVGLAFWAITD